MCAADIRVFLTWNEPLLNQVSERLLKKSPKDLRHTTVVVPSQGSAHHLRAALAQKGAILMPRITLLSHLIPNEAANVAHETEVLAAWVQVLDEVSQEADSERWHPLFPCRPRGSRTAWVLAQAQQLMKLRNTLEQECCYTKVGEHVSVDEYGNKLETLQPSFRLNEQLRLQAIDTFKARWAALTELFARVDRFLAEKLHRIGAGEAYQQALQKRGSHTERRHYIVAGVPEISRISEQYLRSRVTQDGADLEVWVHAPAALADTFDDFGRPLAEYWQEAAIDIADEHIIRCDAPADIAAEAVRLCGGCRSHQAAIVDCDGDQTPHLHLAFRAASPAWLLNAPAGRAFASTPAAQIPELLAEAVKEAEAAAHAPTSINAFRRLMCNTALRRAYGMHGNVDLVMDKIQRFMMPSKVEFLLDLLNPETPLPVSQENSDAYHLLQGKDGYYEWVAAYYRYAKSLQYLVNLCASSFAAAEAELSPKLRKAYAKTPLRKQIEAMTAALHRLAVLQQAGLLSHEYTLRMAAQAMAGVPAVEETERELSNGSIIGWRELSYAPGSRVILAGMHDHAVPERPQSDVLLPESLREALRLPNQKSREARDAFLLQSVLMTHPGEVRCLVAQQAENGMPAAPSVLLLHCGEDSERLAKRAEMLFDENSDPSGAAPIDFAPLWTTPAHELHPGDMESIELITRGTGAVNPYALREDGTYKTFSPSSLAGFLRCPMRFWLKALFGWDAGDQYPDDKLEPEANEYGTIVHAVLQELVDEFRAQSSGDCAEIQEKAVVLAEETLRGYYGIPQGGLSLPMLEQLEMMRKSLESFAEMHATHLEEGWESVLFEHVLEFSYQADAETTIGFSMKVDRIDYNPRRQEWRIIDYKTGSKLPDEKHYQRLDGDSCLFTEWMPGFPIIAKTNSKGARLFYRWHEVQLPLYAFGLKELARLGTDEKLNAVFAAYPGSRELLSEPAYVPSVGYINIAKKGEVAYTPLGFGDEESAALGPLGMESALACVCRAVQLIRSGECLFSAESLGLEPLRFDRLADATADGKNKSAAIVRKGDPRSMFGLPELNNDNN